MKDTEQHFNNTGRGGLSRFGPYAAAVTLLAMLAILAAGIVIVALRASERASGDAAAQAPTHEAGARAQPSVAPRVEATAAVERPREPTPTTPAGLAGRLPEPTTAPANSRPAAAPSPPPTAAGATAVGGDSASFRATRTTPTQTNDELRQLLLNGADLGTGWTPITEDAQLDQSVLSCAEPSVNLHLEFVAEARAGFQRGDTGPFVAQSLHVARSEAAAHDALRSIWGAASCPRWVLDLGEDQRVEYQLAPMPFPAYGDEAVAYAVTPVTPAAPAGDLIIVRQGQTLMALTLLAFEGVDHSQTASLVQAGLGKLSAANR